MSELNKKIKDSEQELDFLNGEVGRVKTIFNNIQKDIEDLEVQKATKYNEFISKNSQYETKLDLLKKDIVDKEGILSELKAKNDSENLILKEIRQELQESNTKMKENTVNHEKMMVQLFAEKENNFNFEKKLSERERKIDLDEKELKTRQESLNRKEESNVNVKKILDNDIEENKKLKFILTSKIQESENSKREQDNLAIVNNARADELSTLITQAKIKITEADDEKARNNILKASLETLKEELRLQQVEITKQQNILAEKESNLILKERDVKIREKLVSLAQRESELNES